MMKEQHFEFDGRALTVRAKSTNQGWEVSVIENGSEATNVVYSVTHITNTDALLQTPSVDLVEGLMEIAREDIKAGRVKLLA